MTKSLLNRYKKTKQEIPLLELELKVMRQGHNGFDNSTILDYRTGDPRPQPVVGFDWEKYDKRQKELDEKKAQAEAVEEWIDAIEDGQTRCVFKMFYMDGMEWHRIAVKTGYAESPEYPRLMIRDKYLKEMKIT